MNEHDDPVEALLARPDHLDAGDPDVEAALLGLVTANAEELQVVARLAAVPKEAFSEAELGVCWAAVTYLVDRGETPTVRAVHQLKVGLMRNAELSNAAYEEDQANWLIGLARTSNAIAGAAGVVSPRAEFLRLAAALCESGLARVLRDAACEAVRIAHRPTPANELHDLLMTEALGAAEKAHQIRLALDRVRRLAADEHTS